MNDEINNEELRKFIYKTHYKTFNKIYPLVKKNDRFKNVDVNDVKNIIKTMLKDCKRINVKKYYNPIYSDHLHAWFMDILDNSGKTDDYINKEIIEANETAKQYPPYWLIFVNVNTKYACSYPLSSKKEQDVKDAIEAFINNHKCVSITCDGESSFTSKNVVKYLKNKYISIYIIKDGNHTSLSPIDSFIRHLRDRNVPTDKIQSPQSYHIKYRNFSVHRMNKLIDTYNNTVHTTTKMKPIDMENNSTLEKKYIAKCLIREMKRYKYVIPIGNYVRVVIRKNPFMKKRFVVSRECYKVVSMDGKNYRIQAEDTSILSLPRWRLIDIGNTIPKNIKMATTVTGKLRFMPISIISKEKGSYTVYYGEKVGSKGGVKANDLRNHHPQVKSAVEIEYEKNH